MRSPRMPTSATASSDCRGSMTCPPASNTSNGTGFTHLNGAAGPSSFVIGHDDGKRTDVIIRGGPGVAPFSDGRTKLSDLSFDSDLHLSAMLLVGVENLLLAA